MQPAGLPQARGVVEDEAARCEAAKDALVGAGLGQGYVVGRKCAVVRCGVCQRRRPAVQRETNTCSVVTTVASFFVLDNLDFVSRAIVRPRGCAGHLVRHDMAAGVRVLVPCAHGVCVCVCTCVCASASASACVRGRACKGCWDGLVVVARWCWRWCWRWSLLRVGRSEVDWRVIRAGAVTRSTALSRAAAGGGWRGGRGALIGGGARELCALLRCGLLGLGLGLLARRRVGAGVLGAGAGVGGYICLP